MRCQCCNKNLNDWESTLKSAVTGDYLDTCKKCLKSLGIETLTNHNDPDAPAPMDYDEVFDDFLEEPVIGDDDE